MKHSRAVRLTAARELSEESMNESRMSCAGSRDAAKLGLAAGPGSLRWTRCVSASPATPRSAGSGILATALGEDLAARGHDVHFISYERPFRLPADGPRLHFHPVGDQRLRAVQVPRLHPAALGAHGRGEPRSSARRAPRPLCRAARDGRASSPARCSRPEQQPRVVTTLHGTDTTLLGHDRRLRARHPARPDSLGRGHRRVRVALKRETQRVLDFDGPIEVIHNFFAPRPPGRSRRGGPPRARPRGRSRRRPLLQPPPGQAHRPPAGDRRPRPPARRLQAPHPRGRAVRAVRRATCGGSAWPTA